MFFFFYILFKLLAHLRLHRIGLKLDVVAESKETWEEVLLRLCFRFNVTQTLRLWGRNVVLFVTASEDDDDDDDDDELVGFKAVCLAG